MNTVSMTPYLMFGGRCEEAMTFYVKVLGARIEMMMRFNESPDPVPAGRLQEGFESKVMHCCVALANGVMLMASDSCDDTSRSRSLLLPILFAAPPNK